MKKILLLTSLLGLLVGCAPQADSVSTPFPPDYIPTVVALTGQAAFATAYALTPTVEVLTPTETSIPLTPPPTSTSTPEPGFSNFARIRFTSPGPMSKIASPLHLQMLIAPGDSEIVKVDLLGEDARLLFHKDYRISIGRRAVYFSEKISFEIRAVSEIGWIQISTKDDKGRMQALNTVKVLLLSDGTSEINIPGNIIYERCVIETPQDQAEVSGGTLEIKGRMWPFNEQPVFLDLIGEDGRTLNTRQLAVDGMDPQSFETTIPYTVTDPTRVRLTIRQFDPNLNRDVYVYTQLVTLNP